jgi:hypothetical protein
MDDAATLQGACEAAAALMLHCDRKEDFRAFQAHFSTAMCNRQQLSNQQNTNG